MQSSLNDLPLEEPKTFNKKDLEKEIQKRFEAGADTVSIMTAEKAAERKKQFREWRKALRCKSMSAPGKRKL
jgi:hypothetical protein